MPNPAAVAISATIFVAYFAFIIAAAVDRDLYLRRVMGGASVGVVLAALMIVISWALTVVYVWWTNRREDRR